METTTEYLNATAERAKEMKKECDDYVLEVRTADPCTRRDWHEIEDAWFYFKLAQLEMRIKQLEAEV